MLFGVIEDSPFILGLGVLCSVFDLAYIALLARGGRGDRREATVRIPAPHDDDGLRRRVQGLKELLHGLLGDADAALRGAVVVHVQPDVAAPLLALRLARVERRHPRSRLKSIATT